MLCTSCQSSGKFCLLLFHQGYSATRYSYVTKVTFHVFVLRSLLGGWPAFFVSLAYIGVCTAIVEQVSSFLKLCIHPSISPSVYFICLCPSIHPSIYLSVHYYSIHPTIRPSITPTDLPFIHHTHSSTWPESCCTMFAQFASI